MNNMFKAIIFDADGMAIKNSVWFSKRLAKQYGVKEELISPFFQNEFQNCIIGQADLKVELEKYVREWQWPGTIDELLESWFSGEDNPDERVLSVVKELRAKGTVCCLATNNEKYRTNYMIERMGFGKVFEKVYSSAFMGFKKPQVEFYNYILNDIGLKKDEVVFWDDEADNLVEAKKQGFKIEKYTDFDSFKNSLKSLVLI